MTGLNKFFLSFFCLSFSVIIPTLHANIYEFDEYWQQRAKQAHEDALKAYDPNPMGVVGNITFYIAEAVIASNSTRRKLEANTGPCRATNPIDRCWRCDPNWANNRKRLADCVQGFGRKTTGGKNGAFYVVTDSSDNDMVNPKPGTLRYAVIHKGPLWIKSMTIRLNQELILTSDKTIDGKELLFRLLMVLLLPSYSSTM
ncbi:Pectate lyase [Quillaja saponaria]|uniref:Pectate lyase n=1 Tax=Quillaja saponaria TaxID=32244 RepID=A0AAD7L9T1_QUISA|nr:Pectate lyase [Quillaja saponaria]